jgi:hypothetical protein
VGDGVADDTLAIQAALDAADGGDLVVRLRPGRYRITDTLQIPAGVVLTGASPRWEDGSTYLLVDGTEFAALRLTNHSGVRGLAISYPGNTDQYDPVPCPPAIELTGINPSVEQVVFQNAYVGIASVNGANTGQAMLRDLTGFVHKTGIHLDGAKDIVRIQNVHWFVPGSPTGEADGRRPFYRRERVGFEFGGVDGLLIDQCFMIGGKTFIHQLPVTDTGGRPHSLGIHITQSWVEAVRYGLLVEGTCGIILSDTQIYISDPEGAGIAMRMPHLYYGSAIRGVQVRCDGCWATGIEYAPTDDHPRNHLILSGVEVQEAGTALILGSGARRVVVSDSFLRARDVAVSIAEGAQELNIHGNLLGAPQAIVYEAEDLPPASRIEGNLVLE